MMKTSLILAIAAFGPLLLLPWMSRRLTRIAVPARSRPREVPSPLNRSSR